MIRGVAMKISILSDGGWGTALSVLLCHNGHQVTMWGPFPDYLAEMARTRRNDKFLKGVALPAALEFEADPGRACAGASILILAAPSQYMRSLLERLRLELGVHDESEEGADKLCMTTPDRKYSLRTVACFGQCALAPVVEINHHILSHVNERTLQREVKALTQGRK